MALLSPFPPTGRAYVSVSRISTRYVISRPEIDSGRSTACGQSRLIPSSLPSPGERRDGQPDL